jgi:hypothetical protein
MEGGWRRRVYLPDVLLTRRPGLWATWTAEDREFARAMERWGYVRVVEGREQYDALRGRPMVCVAVGMG